MGLGIKQLVIDILTAYNSLGDWWLRDTAENSKMYNRTESLEVVSHWVNVKKWCRDLVQRLESEEFNFTEKDSAMWSNMCADLNFRDNLMDYLSDVLEREDMNKAKEIINLPPNSVMPYLKALQEMEPHANVQSQQDITDI